MKSDFRITYPVSRTDIASISISIEVASLETALQVTLETYRKQFHKSLLIEESDIYSDGIEITIESLAFDFLKDFNIPDYIAQQAHEELSRRIMEFVVFQRNKRLQALKDKTVINGQQLHHKGYIDAG